MFEDIRCKCYILDFPLLFQKYKSTWYSEQGVAIFSQQREKRLIEK